MIRRKKAVLLLALVTVFALALPVGTAQAVPLKKWCGDLGGDAESKGKSCTITGTATVGSSLDLPPGNVLEIGVDATLYNAGVLGTSGKIINRGTIENTGIINNNGTIENEVKGTIVNDGAINNNGTIINCGSINGASVEGNPPESCPT